MKILDRLCGKYTSRTKDPNRLLTLPTAITVIRAVVSLALVVAAAGYLGSPEAYWLLLGGLLVYYVGDVLDGYLARKRGEETIQGAILDILADRLVYPVFFFVMAYLHHELIPLAILFIFTFNFLDFYLSVSFLRFGIISINYYWKVSEKIYRWNFCPLAKALNTSIVVILILGYIFLSWMPLLLVAYLYQLGLMVLKIVSIIEMEKITRGCAHQQGL